MAACYLLSVGGQQKDRKYVKPKVNPNFFFQILIENFDAMLMNKKRDIENRYRTKNYKTNDIFLFNSVPLLNLISECLRFSSSNSHCFF